MQFPGVRLRFLLAEKAIEGGKGAPLLEQQSLSDLWVSEASREGLAQWQRDEKSCTADLWMLFMWLGWVIGCDATQRFLQVKPCDARGTGTPQRKLFCLPLPY